MSVDTQAITKLRELTGAGIGDCKATLEEAGGDINKAVELLRKKGAIKAAKKSDRATNEGVIALVKSDGKVCLVGLACETDFVSRNQDFIDTVNNLAAKLMELGVAEFTTWVQDKIKNELSVKIGENMKISAADIVEGKIIGTYLHSNKKVAAVVVLAKGSQELANDIAMQVVAMSPKYLKPEDIAKAELDKEKEIYREQLRAEGKNEAMWDKIIEGKLQKYYSDVCLVKQPFIKDDKISIEKLLQQNDAGEIISFQRYQI
ncbi:MAG: translation elongation factor Ts [Candidatus Buchananbacteria bacterium]